MRNPWNTTYLAIRQRCNNPKNDRFDNYGGRGIKCLITREELKSLWFRDKAHKMKHPSIDRIDNNGHYELSNCRYVEISENAKKRRNTLKPNCPNGHPYSGKNLYLRVSKKTGHKGRVCRTCMRLSRGKWIKNNYKLYLTVQKNWRTRNSANLTRNRLQEKP